MCADEDQIFDLEVFVWHLAAHLCGPQVLLRQLKTASEQHCLTHKRKAARLYWRSSSLLEEEANTASQQEAASASIGQRNEHQRCAFVDVIFEFGSTKPEIPIDGVSHPASSNEADAPLIRMRWGSLWLQSSEQHSSVGRYFSGKLVTLLDLEAHFGDDGPLNVDLQSTEASVLARQMAQCLMSLTAHHHANDWTDQSLLTVPLRYEKISDQFAPLQVANVADTPCKPIDPGLLDMILLQHSFASCAQSNSIQTNVLATEEELKECATYIENEWKPVVCVGSPEKPRSSPPQPNANVAAEHDDSGNCGEGTKRKLALVPKKPVAFRGKGGGVTRVGGKKKKKNLYE